MGRRSKDKVRGLLAKRDLEGLLAWAGTERGTFRVLLSLIYDTDDLMRWRALEALGKVAAKRAAADLQNIRNLIRQLFWSMFEESGGTGWHSPEAIGLIIVNVPELIEEYGRLLVPFFHEEPFERGAYFTVAKAARIKPDLFHEFTDKLVEAAGDPDPYIRVFSVMALSAMGAESALDEATAGVLAADETPLTMYDFQSGNLYETTVKRITGD